MKEEAFYSNEHPKIPEHSFVPEYSALPEYNPVYPDSSFFKESFVTTREENIFQGEAPSGETRRTFVKEKRSKREHYSIFQKLLSSSLRAGAAALCITTVVAAVSFGDDMGVLADRIKKAVIGAERPAFTQQVGYSTEELKRLWEKDPDAPHKYDLLNPIIHKEADCTNDGEVEYVCLECGVHLNETIPAAGHQPGEAIRENEIEATCTEGGSYTEVINCTVCGEELSRKEIETAALGHTAAEAVKENETEATCTTDGEYENVVYCSVCGEELSRDTVTEAATGHTAGTAVRERETAATCTDEGSYTEIVRCTACGMILERREVITAALGHTAGDAVKENETEATCTEDGSYDSVVYCSVCGEEITRETVTIAALGHTAAETVKENETAATCTEDGSYDSVVYCSVCGEEMSRETVTVAALGHTAADAVKENEIAAACTVDGSYDSVVYCSVCGKEISRETITVAATGHTPGDPVEENVVAATCETGGSGEEVIYCSVCGEELERNAWASLDTGHNWGEISYTWTSDYSSVTAAATCQNDPSHTINETVTTSSQVTKEATCEAGGTIVYTASFADPELETQTKTVASAPLGHDYIISYSWDYNGDGDYVCYAYGYCSHDETHTIEEEEVGTATVISGATCTQEGRNSYTASFSTSEFTAQTTEIDTPMAEHTDTLKKEYVTGNASLTGPDCIEGGDYYEVHYCSVCGEELSRSDTTIHEDGPGHSYNTDPVSGEVISCSSCGQPVISAVHSGNYVVYTLDVDYIFDTMYEAGHEFGSDIRLWSYTEGAYVNEGGYEGDVTSDITIPAEYRNSGERFRIDFYSSDGIFYISSNDVEIP